MIRPMSQPLLYLKSPFCQPILLYSVGELASLTFLNISESPSLRTLPESLGNLTKLKNLCLNENPQLTRLPDTLKKLTNLESVRISSQEDVTNIPKSWNSLFI